MGLTAYALEKINHRLAFVFALGKLAVRCVNTGLRPLRLIEKVGVFVLDRKSARLGLAYYAVRVVLTRQHNAKLVHSSLELLGIPDYIEEHGATVAQITMAIKLTETLEEQKATILAAYMFTEFMIQQRSTDSDISGRYTLPSSQVRGNFDVANCLRDYYSSPHSLSYRDEVRRGQARGEYDKEKLDKLARRVWHEIKHRTTHELVDFFLL